MSVNPYESPRVGDPPARQSLGDSDSIRQLLTEIRDQQAELLQLQRAAITRQQSWSRYAMLFMVVPLFIMMLPIYRLMTTPRPVFKTPVRTPARSAPLIPAQPAPTASFAQPSR